MSPILIAGIFLFGAPLLLIIGFAAYIFLGFVNDDPDARNIFRITLAVMGIGALLIVGYFVGTAFTT
jgi:hypothetical protein